MIEDGIMSLRVREIFEGSVLLGETLERLRMIKVDNASVKA